MFSQNPSPPGGLEVVHGHELAATSQSERSNEDDWQINRTALAQANAAHDWFEALRILVYLSNKDGHPDCYKAIAQAAWLVMKIRAPASQATLILYNLLVSLGPSHAASGPVASLANLLAQHRTPEHPDRELAMVQAQQMLRFAAQGRNIETREAFQAWVEQDALDDPEQILPPVLETLDALISGDWWIDQEAVQEDMLRETQAETSDPT